MSEKIEPVAWRYKTDNGWVVTKTATCSASEPLYHATTVSALEARVKELEDRCTMLSAQANEESRRANGAEWRVEGLRDGLLGVESILGPVVKLGDTTSDAAKALEAAGAALNKDQP